MLLWKVCPIKGTENKLLVIIQNVCYFNTGLLIWKYHNVAYIWKCRNSIFGGKFLLQIWNLQCQIHVLSKHRTSRPIRSQDIDRFVFYQKVVFSWSYQKVVCHWMISPFVPVRQQYLYESIIQKKYISKHLTSVHHNSSTLKELFLRFYGSDPRRYDILKYHKFIRKWTFENVFWLSWKVVLFELRHFYM